MSITDIIAEVDRLEPIDQKRLMSHLVLQRLRDNSSYRSEIRARLSDTDPSHWKRPSELTQSSQS